jgi:hypothetical protein
MAGDVYSVDASSLLKLKHDYPRKNFAPVWEKFEELVVAGRLFSSAEVLREIENDDVLGPWAKQHREMFRRLDQDQMDLAKEVVGRFPKLAKPGKLGPAADPFVVALALLENRKQPSSLFDAQPSCLVVTDELRGTQKIPAVCQAYKIGCVALVELLDREGFGY